ncbi:MAG: hypothetical protein AVDCRST_MAG03-2511 [uncultured Rubrobacteraceae bacterium]|uniref:Uncharacterized protein n=1 Tax=uncultured Rubrobacteraceae bacterium TaxID=349277 RepID=A0A6J4PVA3_9ACTN|nr:MAG: hypothetical protein AVDCRST_MAG03-2511 [uncultured Rubrobacteraceae bacterium]
MGPLTTSPALSDDETRESARPGVLAASLVFRRVFSPR